jgi:hypothetical protein
MSKPSTYDITRSLYKAIRREGLYDGEYHALLKLPNGIFRRANYMGPGTNITKRIKDNTTNPNISPPLTEVDKVAQAHDLRYWFSNTAEDARNADLKMISKVNEIERLGADSAFNIAQAKLMKAKTVVEDMGLLKKGSFSNYSTRYDLDPEERKMMMQKLQELEQQGYGRKRDILDKRDILGGQNIVYGRDIFKARLLTKDELQEMRKLLGIIRRKPTRTLAKQLDVKGLDPEFIDLYKKIHDTLIKEASK